jgi:hypothetical protein
MGTTLTGKKIKDTYKSLVKVTDNSEAGSTGKQLSDGNGNDLGLYVDTDGVLGIGATATVSLDVSTKTDAVGLPKGTDAQRVSSAKGHIRYNTTDDKLEFYDTDWRHVATENYVNAEIANIIDTAPSSLDTLNEIAAALNDDANFYTTITNLISTKQAILTAGDITFSLIDPTAIVTEAEGISSNDNDTTLPTSAAVKAYVDSNDTDTTYTIGAADGDNVDEEKIVLTGSDASTDEVVLEAGAGLSIARSGDKITLTNTIADTDTDTTYTISAVDSGDDAIIRLTGSDASTDDVKLVAGSNITITPSGDDITIASTASGGSTNVVVNTFSGDNLDTTFDVSNTIADEDNVQIYIDGVYQSKSNYSTSGTTITFTTAPNTGTDNIEVTHFVSINGTPSIEVDTFNGDASTTAFTLTTEPATKNNLQIYIDGVYQAKANYSVSGTSLTFTTAPQTGTNNIEVTHIKIS